MNFLDAAKAASTILGACNAARRIIQSSLVLGGALLFPAALFSGQQPYARFTAEENVNSRYTVESVEVKGPDSVQLTPSLQQRFSRLVGSHFDPAELDRLAHEVKKELHLKAVTTHVVRGTLPEHVKVVLNVERRPVEFEVFVPKFLYHSQQGWSAQVRASATVARDNVFTFGLVSDGDELIERFSGFRAGYENRRAGSDRIHTAILIEEFHDQWNTPTLQALEPGDPSLYRARRNVAPTATFLITRNLSFQAGGQFEQLQPEDPAAGQRSANALTADIRYAKDFEPSAEMPDQQVTADYAIHSAGRELGSDYHYLKNEGRVRYTLKFGRNELTDAVLAGWISGNAPLFERYVLGTSSLLRGWNRFEIDPLGGTRVAHNSLDYTFRISPGYVQAFYDAGVLWDPSPENGPAETATNSGRIRHSLGVGYRQSVFSVALAFPVRSGRMNPVFMVGMNY